MLKKKNKKEKDGSIFDIQIGRVSLVDKALFAKHLSVMLKSGLSLTEALDIAAQSARGKLSQVLRSVIEAVESGHSLTDAFGRHPKVFSGLFINATRAGESSGTLVENLENISEQLDKDRALISKVRGALIYPVVILTATFALGLALSFLVLPKITPLFEGLRVDLPITTRALIAFSNFVQDHGVGFFISVVVFVVAFLWIIKQKFSQPVTHWILLNAPILKAITKNANLARFTRAMGMLLKSGLRVDEALEIAKETASNYYYRNAIDAVSQNIKSGSKLSDNLAQFPHLFPILTTRMIQVGEESGQFEDTLFYLAGFYEMEVDDATKNLSTALEPMLLLFIGSVVGFLALSIITPIYDITGNISR